MSLLPPLAPWQQRAYAQACAAIDAGHFGHATLVVGPARIGKRVLAERLAQRVLCLAPQGDGEPCGQCKACHLFASRAQYDPMELRPDGTPAHPWGHSAHPDLLLVGHEVNQKTGKPRTELVIEQVRAISEKLGLTAQLGGAQIVIVDPVEAINWNAFNALLKTLEEPGALRFVLSCGSTDSLLPTIRSRCQAVRLPPPAREQALTWLQSQGVSDAQEAQVLLDACGGRPLEALQRQREGMDAQAWRQFPQWVASGQSAAVSGWPLPVLVEALSKLCHDRSLVSLGLAPRYFTRSELAAGDLDQLTAWAAQLRRHARVAEHPFSAGLAVEALMLGGRF